MPRSGTRDVCLAALVTKHWPARHWINASNLARGRTKSKAKVYPYGQLKDLEIEVIWPKIGPLSPKALRITWRNADDNTQIKTLAFIGWGRSARTIEKRLRQKVESFYQRLANKYRAPVDKMLNDAANNLWQQQRYIKGSTFSKWRSAYDNDAVKSEIKILENLSESSFIDEKSRRSLIDVVRSAKDLLSENPISRIAHNQAFLEKEEQRYAWLFNSVEAGALTKEQVRAALIFDDLNLTVAAAGSGKTSVIVAKAAYAIASGLFKDHEILALAFNRKAAEDLAERLSKRLSASLKKKVSIRAETFHKFGKSYSEKGKNRRPLVVELDEDEGRRIFFSAYDRLIKADGAFRENLFNWLSLARYPEPTVETAKETIEEGERRYEQACRQAAKAKRAEGAYAPSIPTLKPGLLVRSLEEAAIANWLFVRGVDFDYEKPASEGLIGALYGLSPVTASGRSYRPDFSYLAPAAAEGRVYHEHFGIGQDGKAPDFMGGDKYVAQANKKREAFKSYFEPLLGEGQDVPFFETTSGRYKDGSLFDHLKKQLDNFKIPVGAINQAEMDKFFSEFRDASDFEWLLLSFIHTMRSSGLSEKEISYRAQRSATPFRAELFLNIAFPLRRAIEAIYGDELIEYSDMIAKGVKAVSSDVHDVPYKLILVDEFQDIAKQRMDLVKAIRSRNEDSVLFFVGDDWQAINRFAGSDLNIFHSYVPESAVGKTIGKEQEYTSLSANGHGSHLIGLTTTFRCAQGIADVARRFITNSKGHIDKEVHAAIRKEEIGVVKVVEHADDAAGRFSAVRAELEAIAKEKGEGGGIPSVFLLTRNKAEGAEPDGLDGLSIQRLKREFDGRIKIMRDTMHSSKGLEADYCLIAGLDTGYKGFPSLWDEDPLLELVRPRTNDPLGEERRLFYVALTRGRRKTILFAAAERPSTFIIELENIADIKSKIEWVGAGVKRRICPACKMGVLRPIPKTTWHGCSRYPRCGFKAARV